MNFGELAHILLCRLDVFDGLEGDLGNAVSDLAVGQLEGCGRPFVKLARVSPHCFAALRSDVPDHALDNLDNLVV